MLVGSLTAGAVSAHGNHGGNDRNFRQHDEHSNWSDQSDKREDKKDRKEQEKREKQEKKEKRDEDRESVTSSTYGKQEKPKKEQGRVTVTISTYGQPDVTVTTSTYGKPGRKGHGVKIVINGSEVQSTTAPIVKDGSTLVPFRIISEQLKAKVTYNAKKRSVTVVQNVTIVTIVLDQKVAYVNGKAVNLDVPATVENGSTMVPVRFISEALDANVKWDAESGSVVIDQ
nr:copper amine oxidase N-terminal domain-containing protein [Paenibacillus sediminis]